MRTTLTLDDDVAAKLQDTARKNKRSFKDTVNEAIRLGLAVRKEPPLEPFKVRASAMGLRPGLNYDNIEELLDQVEGPMRR